MTNNHPRTRAIDPRPLLITTAAVGLALLSLPLLAQQAGDGPAQAQAERAQAQVEFTRGNEEITVRSVMPGSVANAEQYRVSFDELDTQGRGYVTRDQLPEDHALYHEFHLVDRDRNGRITREELQNWR